MDSVRSQLQERLTTHDPAFRPAPPRDSKGTGLDRAFLSHLILKSMYFRQEMLDYEIATALHLPFTVVEDHIGELRRERQIEIAGPALSATTAYRLRLSAAGAERARSALDISSYVGPAPVTLAHYVEAIESQTPERGAVQRQRLEASLSSLVLPRDVIDQVGPAFDSRRALFLHGHAGNGKTALASAIASALGDTLLLPYAVEIDGHVIKVLDPIFHGHVEPGDDGVLGLRRTNANGTAIAHRGPLIDERWAEVRRPVVFAGGELEMDMLDLTFNEREGFYEAPLHMKANGGVFIIDDFGRQRVVPRDLLNRWIVPLDRGVDFLRLHTGRKFPIPFRMMVIFATNLAPRDLVDEAFLRRIPYKVEMRAPTREQYHEIFRRECEAVGIEPDPAAIDYVYRRYYEELGFPVRACHPRDLLRKLRDLARWHAGKVELGTEALELVCRSYFTAGGATPTGSDRFFRGTGARGLARAVASGVTRVVASATTERSD